MIVVGMDLGTRKFHAAMIVLDEHGVDRVHDVYEAVPSRSEKTFLSQGMALQWLFRKADDFFLSLARDWPGEEIAVFVEEPPKVRSVRTMLLMGEAAGAIVAATGPYSTRVYLIPVSAWKLNTVGKGNASKESVALWLTQRFPSYSARCGVNQDLVDATCLALYGAAAIANAALVSPS